MILIIFGCVFSATHLEFRSQRRRLDLEAEIARMSEEHQGALMQARKKTVEHGAELRKQAARHSELLSDLTGKEKLLADAILSP